MKNTLHILTLSRRAGLEVMFLNYLKHMKLQNPEFLTSQFVFTTSTLEYFKHELDNLGVRVFVINNLQNSALTILKALNKLIKRENIEVLYGQNYFGNILAAAGGFMNPKLKVICHEHGSSWHVSGIKQLILTRIFLRRANSVICNSNAAQTLLKKRFKASSKKLTVVANGVPFKYDLDMTKDKRRILFAGRLDYVKSPHTLIYMLKEIQNRNFIIHLDILGDGILQEELEILADELDVKDSVCFHGNVNNVNEFMAKSYLLILPSIREALGNVIIEAAFQKTPTIATNIDGIPEVIIDGKTGILIKPTVAVRNKAKVKFVVDPLTQNLKSPLELSPSVLADEVIKLLQDQEKCRQLGEKAQIHVKKNFTKGNYYKNIIKIINN